MRSPQTTRRELITRGVAAGAAAGVTLRMQPGVTDAADAQEPTAGRDAGVLRSLLSVELLLVFVYGYVGDSGVLDGSTAGLVNELLSQERAHVRVLGTELRHLGAAEPHAPADPGDADAQLAAHHVKYRLEDAQSVDRSLSLLLAVEQVAAGQYYSGILSLSGGGLVQIAAQIMANEAQHAAILSEAQAPGKIARAVPGAFVQGTQ